MAPSFLARLLLCAAMAAAQEDEQLMVDLDASNFDDALDENTEVLVVFWAPWSKKANDFFADYKKVAKDFEARELDEKVFFGRCDIDRPLKVSYLERYGVERLPTLVLFRNGDPFKYEGNDFDHRTISTFLTNALANDPPARKSAPMKKSEVPRIGDEKRDKRQLGATEGQGAKESTKEATIAAQKTKSEQPAKSSAQKESEQAAAPPAPAAPAAPAAAAAPTAPTAAPTATTPTATTPATPAAAASGGSGSRLCGVPSAVVDVSDASFKTVVLDKSVDVILQFFKHTPDFCAKSGKAFDAMSVGMSSKTLRVARMDCDVNKSPFVFEDNELPLAMMFPADSKAPIEYDQSWAEDKLTAFVKEHMSVKVKEEL